MDDLKEHSNDLSIPPPTSSPSLPSNARPYPHQVGGHGQLAVTHTGQVLKPVRAKELKFYTYIHSDRLPSNMLWIRQVTPKFYGQVPTPSSPSNQSQKLLSNTNISHNQNINGPHTNSLISDNTTTTLPSVQTNIPTHSKNTTTTTTTTTAMTPTTITTTTQTNINPIDNNTTITTTSNSDIDTTNNSNLLWHVTDGEKQAAVHMSPWAQQMTSRWLSSSNSTKSKPPLSIVLEDINDKFHLPCILDCKIGTRHYDDDASEEKRRRHIAKANATTSAKCGVRYIGMQSFKRKLSQDTQKGAFECRNKYHGRSLTEQDLVPEATWFFHDGHQIRIDCIQLMLNKLQYLRQLLGSQYHFYFYSSSLLLVYEGILPQIKQPRVDIRMIDFAHTTLSHGHRDDGYLKGIDYLIKILTQILENERLGNTQFPTKPVITEETEIAGL